MDRSATPPLQFAVGSRDSLQSLLALTFRDPARDDNDLRDAVRDFVRAAKRVGTSPERVVVELKQTVTSIAMAVRASYRMCNALTDRVVGWFIDAYYDSVQAPATTLVRSPAKVVRPRA